MFFLCYKVACQNLPETLAIRKLVKGAQLIFRYFYRLEIFNQSPLSGEGRMFLAQFSCQRNCLALLLFHQINGLILILEPFWYEQAKLRPDMLWKQSILFFIDSNKSPQISTKRSKSRREILGTL